MKARMTIWKIAAMALVVCGPAVQILAATASDQAVNVAVSAVGASFCLTGQGTSFTVVQGPTHGTIDSILVGYNIFLGYYGYASYTPTPGYVGPDSFVWNAADGAGISSDALCNITVTTNVAPTAGNQTVTPFAQNSSRVSINLNVYHYPDTYQPMSVMVLAAPTKGALEYLQGTVYQPVPMNTFVPLSNGYDLYYTPNPGVTGIDSFVWKVSDSIDCSGVATCSVTITANHLPVANPQAVTPFALNSSRVPISMNYSDSDYYQIKNTTVTVVPTNGTLEYLQGTVFQPVTVTTSVPATTLYYTPTPGYIGADTFAWNVNDGAATSSNATCSITVTANNAPVANPQLYSLPQGTSRYYIGLNCTHADSYQVMRFTVTAPGHGVLENYCNGGYQIVPTGISTITNCQYSLYYTPSPGYVGPDSIVWKVSDGVVTSGTATCNLAITTAAIPIALDQGVSLVQNAARSSISLNFYYPTVGMNMSWTLVFAPTNGTLETSISGNYQTLSVGSTVSAGTWYYSPDPGYTGTDTFAWQMSDGITDSGVATCSITVAPNNPPVINHLLTSVSCLKNSVNNDMAYFMACSDLDSNQTLTFTLVSAPTNGTLTSGGNVLHANDTVTNHNWNYTPATNYTGPDGFVWNVNDGIVGSPNATVAITVVPAPTPGAPPVFKAGIALMDGTNALCVRRHIVNGRYDYGCYSDSCVVASPEVVDWNNDGLMDLVVGEADGRIALFINQGTKGHPVFNGYRYLTMQDGSDIKSWGDGACTCDGGGPECSVPRVADWNNDGRKDLLVGEWAQANLFVYFNVGADSSPVFDRKLECRLKTSLLSGYWPTAMPFLADWNGDGIMDLVSGNETEIASDGIINVFLSTKNDHRPGGAVYNMYGNTENYNWNEYEPTDSFQTTTKPTLTVTGACPVGSRKSVALADWTGTGRKDLVVGMQDGTVWCSPNAGTSNFPVFTNCYRVSASTNLICVGDPAKINQDPPPPSNQSMSKNFPAVNEARISVADLDGDGLLDLIVGDVNGFVTVFYQYNPKPVAIDQKVIVMPNHPKNITLTARVDSSNAVAYTLLSSPTNGTLAGVVPNLTYTPHVGYTGLDSFTFNAVDGTNVSRTGTIYITVKSHPPVALWTSPATLSSTAIVNMNTSCAITLTATDESDEPLAYSVVTPPLHGTLSGSAPNLVYTPNANYTGLDGFTYKANDSYLDSNITTVNLDVCVRAVNFQPVATPVPAGYVKDSGALFDGGRGYGWSANLTNSTTCWGFNPDPRMDTFVYSVSNAVWTCNLPNATYYVSLGCGYYENRGAWADNHQDVVSVQGSNLISEAAANANLIYTFVGQIPAIVTNGQLTLSIGGGASRTRINFIEIRNAYHPVGAATFVAQDATTQGSWRGTYGADGSMVCNKGEAGIPPYAVVTAQPLANGVFYATTLSYPSTDIRALQCPSEASRIASYWNRASGVGNNFTFDLNFTDGLAHRVAAYFLAWNNPSWSERIDVLDAGDNTVLDTRSLSNFVNGVYLVWNLQGHVKIRVTSTGGSYPMAIMSGLFFGSQAAPQFLVQPLDTAVKTGQSAVFTVVASGAPLNYAWQKSNDGGTTWTNISGMNATTCSITTASNDNGAKFRCVVTNALGAAVSDPATLTTSAQLPLPPVINSPLFVTARFQLPFRYAITADNSPTSFDGIMPGGFTVDRETGVISTTVAAVWVGSTSARTAHTGSLTIPITVINGGGIETKNLVISVIDQGAPVIGGNLAVVGTVGVPFSYQIAAINEPTTFSATGLPPGLSIIATNGIISGTPTSAFIGTTNVTIGAGNTSGTAIGNLALTINPVAIAPTITAQPVNVTLLPGQFASFGVAATGTAPLTYKWRKNGSVINGATSALYTTPGVTTNDNNAQYSVIVSNMAGFVTSSVARLTVRSSLCFSAFRHETSGFGMDFGTDSGVSYNVQWKTNLLTDTWHLYTNFTGNGGTAHVCFTNALPQGFFQIQANHP